MTAVELLVNKIASKIDDEYWCNQQNITEYVEQAKEMHYKEIIDAFKKGQALGFDDNPNYMAEQYYNETFKN